MRGIAKQAQSTRLKLLIHAWPKYIDKPAIRSTYQVAVHIVKHPGIHAGVINQTNRPSLLRCRRRGLRLLTLAPQTLATVARVRRHD